jgi:CBS domain containing-hemolysin-like protein
MSNFPNLLSAFIGGIIFGVVIGFFLTIKAVFNENKIIQRLNQIQLLAKCVKASIKMKEEPNKYLNTVDFIVQLSNLNNKEVMKNDEEES